MGLVRKLHLLLAVILIIVASSIASMLAPGAVPWIATGHLVIAVRAVPTASNVPQLRIGIDDIVLHHHPERTRRFSIRNRYALLDPQRMSTTVLIDHDIAVGEYRALQFTLTQVMRTGEREGGVVENSAVLNTPTITIPASYTVKENETTVIILSFETSSLRPSTDGTETYIPVIQLETRHGGKVTADEDGYARIEGGTISDSATYGMDTYGTMRRNFRPRLKPMEETTILGTPTKPSLDSIHTSSSTESTTTPESSVSGDANEIMSTSTATSTH